MAGRRQRDPDDLTGDLVPAPVFTGRQVEILLHIADDNWRHDAGTWDVPDAEIAEIERRDRALTAEAKLKELQEEVDRVWRAHDQLLDLTRPK